ncbi:MAG: SsrA-binding protein [Mycoplasmataceae bacterium]|jgi:SsrA-binding protein|nr:SsrA-binding protein [Mycoplasmataceae bacterium]
MKVLLVNKKINLNYSVSDIYESGLSLKGTEVKSLVKSNGNIDEAFVVFAKQEAYVINMYIATFEQGNINNVDPYRRRKLLLHKNEIIKMEFQSKKERLAIIPTKVFFKNGVIKLNIALAKSKKAHDKRDDIKKRDAARESRRYI